MCSIDEVTERRNDVARQTEATTQGTSPANMRIGLFIPCYIDSTRKASP
jgi:hypothetical protein